MPDYEVIIAGAGPAGCALALYLAKRDISVLLLEGQLELPQDLRASTFHPPSLDMLATLGVTQQMLELGLITRTYQYRDRETGECAIFDLGLLEGETDHPFRLQCEQYKMTGIVARMLPEYPNTHLLYRHRVLKAWTDGEEARVEVETPEGVKTLSAHYVVGADGASSAVRKSLGIEYEGFTYPERFLVVSTDFEFKDVFENLSNVNYIADPEEWCVILRTPEVWRVLFPTEIGADESRVTSDEFIQERLHRLAGRSERFTIRYRTLYRVHQRVAATFRKDRVLLVGDAAHINNPLGGMGMNSGLHDAFNLGEKLARILRDGERDDADALLDLYNRQRRGITLQFVQEHTIRNKRLMEERDPALRRERQAQFMRTASDPAAAKAFLLKTSMIQSLRDASEIQ